MAELDIVRRQLLVAGGAALLASPVAAADKGDAKEGPQQEKKVTAVEELMREHGVLRRVLLVYIQSAPIIRATPARYDASALGRATRLFQKFGEEYHEKKVEEAYIFPVLKKSGGENAHTVDILLRQHARGREVTAYIVAASRSGKIGTGNAAALADALVHFVSMYENHAAREDTTIFPAWKTALSQAGIDAMGEKFDEIEDQVLGEDGYENALKEIEAVEQSLGFSDLDQFTSPAPPKG